MNMNDMEICETKTKRNAGNSKEKSRMEHISVVPSELKFSFNSENIQIQEKTISLTNYFMETCPVEIFPLETSYFQIKKTPQRKYLNPGSILKIRVLFAPEENRDYNDLLKIRYFGDRVIQVKLFGKTAIKYSFPTTVNFGNVPLGRSVSYEIPINSDAKEVFSFAILPTKGVSSLDVYPRWGRVLPGQKPVTVMIIYKPVRYVSMHSQIRIFMSNMCKTPHTINFYAYTCPGLLRNSLEKTAEEMIATRKPRRKKIERSFRREIVTESKERRVEKVECITKYPKKENILLRHCGRYPSYTAHAVNCILNWNPRRLYEEHELKGPLGLYLFQSMEEKAERLMEFLERIERRRRENEQVKFQSKNNLNDRIQFSDENRVTEVRLQREQKWEEYKNSITNTIERTFKEQEVKKNRQRILRASCKHPTIISTRSQEEDELFLRRYKIFPFLQAARKIVLKNRLRNVLAKLQHVTAESVNRYEENFSFNEFLKCES